MRLKQGEHVNKGLVQGELRMNMSNSVRIALLAAALLGVAACNDIEDLTLGQTEQSVVSTNLTAYASGQSIVVNYDGMLGATSDFIVLAHPSDPANVYELLKLTGGGTSGSLTFDSTQLGAGTYEARAYYDWYGTHSYVIQQTSPSFTVTGGPSLMATQSSFVSGSPVLINYSNLTTSTSNWIAIYKPGSADSNYVAYQYTPAGTASGQLTFNGLAVGTYEARYHHQYYLATYATSAQFTVSTQPAATTITTDFAAYGTSQTINTTYANMPGNTGEYVAVAQAGAPAGSVIQQFSTGGQINGTQAFSPLPAGSYEARAYNAAGTILATKSFSVASTTVTTDRLSYSTGQSVTVTFSGMPATATAYVAISLAGAPDAGLVQYQSTGGATSGTRTFSGLPAGTYEARAYSSSYVVIARSIQFSIGQACTVPAVRPVLGALVSGDLVLDTNTADLTAALSVPLGTSLLFTSIRESEPSPKYGDTLCELVAAGVHCKRDRAGTDTGNGTITVHYTVATFTSGVTVQRGLVDTFTTNPASVTLTTPVDLTTSFVLLGGSAITGAGWGNNEFTRGRLVDSTHLEIAHALAGSQVAWQVVTMTGASVTRGTTALTTNQTTSTVTIPSAPSGSLLLASYTTDVSSAAAATLMLQSRLASPTSLSFQRVQGGSNLSVAWELVSLPYATISGLTSFGAGVASASATVPGITAATSVALSSTQSILGQSGGSSSFTGAAQDLVGESAFTMTTGNNTLSLTRLSSVASATLPWTVIDFAHDCAGN